MTQELVAREQIEKSEAAGHAAAIEGTRELDAARVMPCRNDDELEQVTCWMARVKKTIAEIEATRKDMKAPILEAGRKVDALFKPATKAWQEVMGVLKNEKAGPYLRKKEQERLAAEARANADAEKERKRLAKLAQRAAERGDTEKQLHHTERMAAVPTEVIVPEQKPEGVTVRKTWKARVTDRKALAAAIGRGEVAETYMEPNMKQLHNLARATQGHGPVPGVEFYEEESVVSLA